MLSQKKPSQNTLSPADFSQDALPKSAAQEISPKSPPDPPPDADSQDAAPKTPKKSTATIGDDVASLKPEPGSPEALAALRAQALQLPKSPGVYLMKDKGDKIIYVGKAKILPKRVSGYFRDKTLSARVSLMVSQIQSFDFMLTSTEKEALILENSLIKTHHPKYNVILRDDKTYPSLRLSVKDPFPRLEIVRRPARDGSVIFGPFPSSGALRETLRMINRLFPLRKCARADVKKTDRPCLNFQIGQCVAPCRPDFTPEEYKALTDQVRLFFQGKRNELVKDLEAEMREASARYEFETAAAIRDRLHDVRKTLERQVVVLAEGGDLDVWSLERQGNFGQAVVLTVRNGVVTGGRPLAAEGVAGTGPEAILSLVGQYYDERAAIPDELVLPSLPAASEAKLTAELLTSLKGSPVAISSPNSGERLKLLAMASENAKATLAERIERLSRTRGALAEVMARLALPSIPRRLECFDLAHLQGEQATAGMVVMVEGELKKSQYRKFKISQAKGGDDYAGMREVVRRRFRPDREDKWPSPDLLLIDGGKGQISAALAAFEDLNLKPPPIAGIAKERGSVGSDRIFIPGRANPIDLKPGSAGLMLLMRLRDEAHRFSRTYHHSLRKSETLSSPFEGVKGLGPVRLKALSIKYPALEDLLAATDEELLKLTRLSPKALGELRNKASSLMADRDGMSAASEETLAGEEVLASEDDLTNYYGLANEDDLASEEALANEEALASEEDLTSGDGLSSDAAATTRA